MALAPRDVDMARYSWLTIEVASSMRSIEILWIRTPPPSDFEARPPRRLRYSPKLTTSQSVSEAVRQAVVEHIRARRADREFPKRLHHLLDSQRDVFERLDDLWSTTWAWATIYRSSN
jgi:hypothetical protein